MERMRGESGELLVVSILRINIMKQQWCINSNCDISQSSPYSLLLLLVMVKAAAVVALLPDDQRPCWWRAASDPYFQAYK